MHSIAFSTPLMATRRAYGRLWTEVPALLLESMWRKGVCLRGSLWLPVHVAMYGCAWSESVGME